MWNEVKSLQIKSWIYWKNEK